MPNDVQKQAQLFTKIKEKIAPSGRRKSKLRPKNWSPIRFMGKALLKKRSPDIYGEALSLLEKADPIIREAASKQRVNLAEMKKYRKGLSITGFSIATNKFIIEQKLINGIISKIINVFDQLADKKDALSGAKAEDRLNAAINMEIGKRPGMFQKVEDIPDEKEYLEERLDKISKLYFRLTKEALFGGRYWRGTKSGRRFEDKFKIIYKKFENISDKNIAILEELDELLDIGDPGEYLRQARKFANIVSILNEPEISIAWENFKKQEAPVIEQAPVPIPAPTPVAAPITVEQPVLKQQPPTPSEQIYSKPQTKPGVEPSSIDIKKVKEFEEQKQKEKEMSIQSPIQNKPAHNKFIEKLTKKADNGMPPVELAQYILKYAEKIEKTDVEYSLKLMAIAEGILNNE